MELDFAFSSQVFNQELFFISNVVFKQLFGQFHRFLTKEFAGLTFNQLICFTETASFGFIFLFIKEFIAGNSG